MFRAVNIVTMKNPNTHLRMKTLIAKRMIKRGELITIHPVPREGTRRSWEERKEIDRLAKVAYEHACRSG